MLTLYTKTSNLLLATLGRGGLLFFLILFVMTGVGYGQSEINIDSPAPVLEGDAGSSQIDFTVSIDQSDPSPITVVYTINGGNEDTDTGTLTFLANTTILTQTVTVTTTGDTVVEADENVSVTLSNASPNARIRTAVGNSSFTDDDATPAGYSVSINQDPINTLNQDNISITFSGAPLFTSSYNYSFTSDGDGNTATVTGGGSVLLTVQTISPIDLSSLPDGNITLTFTLTNIFGNTGNPAFDFATKNTAPPSGYSVTIDQDPIGQANENNISFTITGAEVGADYEYTFTSSGGGTAVTGSGGIGSTTQQINAIDLSGLISGTIELSVILSNENGDGLPATDTATKEACNAGTTAPTLNSTGVAFCGAFNQDLDLYISNVAPAGAELRWSTNSDISVGGYLVSSVVSDPGTYYGFFYDQANDCFSAATPVTLTQSNAPTTGIATNLGTCSDTGDGDTLVDLDSSLTGADTGSWQLLSAPSGASISINANNRVNFNGEPEGVYTFRYTTNTAQGECTNQSVDITVTVYDCSEPCNAGRSAPALNGSSSTIEFCDAITANLNDYVISTPPAGAELVWSTSNDPEETGAHLNNPNVIEPGTFYAFYYDDTNDCGSPVLAITLELNNTPVIDSTAGDASCGPSILNLSATASVSDSSTITYTWYDAATGGNIVGTSATFITNTLSETTSYYVSASANGCESERVEVMATIINALSPGIPIEDLTVCNISSDEGPTTFDLDDGLMGQDAGTWTLITDPSNGDLIIGTDNIVDFTGLASGAYVFEYTTETVGECTETSSVQLTITVQDCISNETIDLAITKTVDGRESYLIDEEVVFLINVEIVDGNTATDIIISDVLDEDFQFIDAQATIGEYDVNSGEWNIPQLQATDTQATLAIRVRPTAAGQISNTASLVSSLPADGNLNNNSSTVQVEVNRSQCEDLGTICNIFSPNSDGYNDTLTLVGHAQYPNNTFEVFDRYGNSVFQMDGYDSSWDGTGKNGDLPKGTYFYILDLNGDGTDVVKGWIQIVRNN